MTGLWIIGLLLITPINIPLQKKEAVKRADDILIPIFFCSCIMDNNAVYAAQHAQLGKIYGGLDPTCR